jgi:uncharacterized protein (DUF433 family)
MVAKLISTAQEAAQNIRAFAEEVSKHPALQSKLGQVHAWYALRAGDNQWAFGSSKFVGYTDNGAAQYLKTYQMNADGRETERALAALSSPVDLDSPLGRELTGALEAFLRRWDRKPRRNVRISIVAGEADRAFVSKRRTSEALLARISSDPKICGGRPCVKGTRMRVVDIVEAIAGGATEQELLCDFDYLKADDIAAALLYAARAADHRVIQTV